MREQVQQIMEIDFNSIDFNGFEDGEIIMLDSCIIFAYINELDSWHDTVSNLLDSYILNEEISEKLALYTTSCAINEVVFLITKKLRRYIYDNEDRYSDIYEEEIRDIITKTLDSLKTLIEDDFIGIADADKESVLKQIELEELDPADALHISVANRTGQNFLTLDNKLKDKVVDKYLMDLKNIKTIYYTTSNYRV